MRDSSLAPGVPSDYYDQIFAVERDHWWYRGMREIARALLGGRLADPSQRLLDAGCGTGGFLRWALDVGSFHSASGVDISSAAIDLARSRVPEATLDVAPLWELPYADDSFELAIMNDVLQHLPEDQVGESLRGLHRVLVTGGALLVRTNGSRGLRRERADWRAYDDRTLRDELEAAGFRVERLTYANVVPSLWASLRGRVPHAPTEEHHGIADAAGAWQSAVGARLLGAEARFLTGRRRRLPFGHTLFALAIAS